MEISTLVNEIMHVGVRNIILRLSDASMLTVHCSLYKSRGLLAHRLPERVPVNYRVSICSVRCIFPQIIYARLWSGKMGRFRAFFSKSNKQTQSQSDTKDEKVSGPGECGIDVASLPVAGMQRSNQANYILSHTPARATTVTTNESSSTATTASSHTAVEDGFVSKHGESQWQGKPQGKAYDKREELSEADEDMWAKMAM